VILSFMLLGAVLRTLSGALIDPQAWAVVGIVKGLILFCFFDFFLFFSLVLRWFGLIKPKLSAGQPKRLAQFVAILITMLQIVLYQIGYATVAVWVSFLHYTLALATVFEYCAACAVFFLLMVLKIIPASICDDCRIDFVVEEEPSPNNDPAAANYDPECPPSIEIEFNSSSVAIDEPA
jgi:hypothetical protein